MSAATKNNVYKKLAQARVALQKRNVKRGGKNTFVGYDYFELADFIPHVNEIFAEAGLLSVVSYGAEEATLTVIDTDKPEDTVVFATPMAAANLKGAHAVQNLGAVQTYIRRYLYMTALEIVEHDVLDMTQGSPDQQRQQRQQRNQAPRQQATQARRQQPSQAPRQHAPQGEPPQGAGSYDAYGQPPPQAGPARSGSWRPSQAQIRRMFAIASGAGVDEHGVRAAVLHVTGQDSPDGIATKAQYDEVCSVLQTGGVGDVPDGYYDETA